MSSVTVEILIPFKYFTAGQIVNVSEASAATLIADGRAKKVIGGGDVETKESPKKILGKESE